MGIEKFFNTFRLKYNKENLIYDTKYPYKKINCKYLFFDFNSIVHNISQRVLEQLNLSNKKDYKLEELNKLIISNVIHDLKFIIKNNFIVNELKLIYIAIDGTPSKAKIIEQRKRRFIGAIDSSLKKKIIPETKISWSKNNISPATNFMNLLIKELKKKSFIDELKKINFNINFIISDTKEFGEGEKKIIDYIINKNIKDNITIFSPDADMILLSLLLLNKASNITILRRDQQESEKIYKITKDSNLYYFAYNIIDIDTIGKTLYSYVKQKTGEINSINVIKDIVLLFTFFGDDFLPKLESYNVNNDIDILLNTYSELFLEIKEYFIKGNKINIKFLKKLINKLSLKEDEIIKRNYIINRFHNYKRIKKDIEKYLNKKINHEELLLFLKTYNFYRILEENESLLINLANEKKNEKYYIDYLKRKVEVLFNFKSNEVFFPTLKEIDDIIESNIYSNDLIRIDKDNKINILYHYIKKYKYPDFNNYYKLNSNFRPVFKKYIGFLKRNYSKENYYHKNNLEKLNDNSKKKYEIDNMLDDYYNKFNKEDIIDLGNPKDYDKSVQKFYDFYFKGKSKNDIIKEYLDGLYWLNEYYYNDRLSSTWFYKNFKSPLLKDINTFFTTNNYNFDYIEKKYNFNGELTFTNLEQLIYITPFNLNKIETDSNFEMLNYLGKENIEKIKKFLQNPKIKPIYFNIDKIVNDILQNKNNSLYCFDAYYFNKCYLKDEEILYTYDDNVFINEFRKIINPNEQFIDINKIDGGYFYTLLKNKKYEEINELF